MKKIELGWPLPKRQAHFLELEKSPQAEKYKQPIRFMDDEIFRPIWRIPLSLPKYRLLNGRTSSLQEEWIANNNAPEDFFSADPEREEAQETQHGLLKKLIHEKSLQPYFADTKNKQEGYLILDNLGFVVNGNRRLCTWRELYASDSTKYSHFEYIDVLVLPPADSKAIDKLEGSLQVEKDIRSDYTWHALANMMISRMNLHGLDISKLAEFYDLTENEIKKYLDMRNYAVEYLKERGQEGQWSLVTDKKYAFDEMVNYRKQMKNAGEKRLFEVQAYALIDDPAGGRLYEFIPDIYKYRESIKQNLLERFPISASESAGDDLLGGDPDEEIAQLLSKEIDKPANRKEATDIIKDTIETRYLLDKEKDTAKYVLKQLQKANASIQSALAGTKYAQTDKNGIPETLVSIESGITSIRNWLKK